MAALPIIAFAAVAVVVSLVLPFYAAGTMPQAARRVLHLSGVCIAVGVFLFCVPLIVNAGQLLPDGVEWPVGHAHEAVETESGHFVVPLDSSGRVQVYDQNLNFVTGWHVNANGGSVELAAPAGEGDIVDVYALRLKQRSRYALDGTLLAQEPYTRSEFLQIETGDRSVPIPTRWWQYPFISPAWGGLFLLPGIGTQLFITRRYGVTLPFTPEHLRRS